MEPVSIWKTKLPTLAELGAKYQTDKVYSHHYETLYEKHLARFRGLPINFLEIGLGCGMPRGTGASAYMWREYFGPLANIHFIEYSKTCGEEWFKINGTKLNVKMHYGSQDNEVFLRYVINEMKYFDIVIDDGGHTMKQQITSIQTLLPAVKSNGLYVIEDLETSYHPVYIDQPRTTISLIKDLVDDVQGAVRQKNNSISHKIAAFEIGDAICLFTIK